jgi:SpoVK/Ycf46/Vps4 family AAA+-type ATPase
VLHPIEQASVTLASELRHDRITELHVMVAWLQQAEAPEIPGKDTLRVNGHILLRELLATGVVERNTSDRIALSERARFWLDRAIEAPGESESLQELATELGIRGDELAPRKPRVQKAQSKKVPHADQPPDSLEKILEELDSLVGLASVKERVRTLVQQQLVNKKMKDRGVTPPATGLNLVFSGNPGTGKTTVARILSRVYRQMGLLSKGHLVEVGSDELVAGYVGQTALKTKQKIQEAEGGTLFIDEAYSLVESGRGELGSGGPRGFGAEAISTLVAEMENRRDDLAVIAAGYTEPMIDFLKANPGLESRFTATLHFEDYNTEELAEILVRVAKEHGIAVPEDTKAAVLRHLTKNRTTGSGGNGRYVRKLFLRMYELMSLRAAADGVIEDHEIEAFLVEDVPDNLEFGSRTTSIDEVLKELDSLVGMDEIKKKVRTLIDRMKARVVTDAEGRPSVDMNLNLIFAGDPGTGKTTVARILANAYRALGVLPRGQLVEVGRQDLVAGFVGQTALKTQKKIEAAMGGVLFIDEAYALSSQGGAGHNFGMEALTTLVQEMENNRGQFAVIAAGYRQDMEFFVESNPGLASRFDEHLIFPNYTKDQLLEIFLNLASEKQLEVSDGVTEALGRHFANNSATGVNGNGRYVRKLFEKMYDNLAVRVARESLDNNSFFYFAPEDVPEKLATDAKPRIGFG